MITETWLKDTHEDKSLDKPVRTNTGKLQSKTSQQTGT